MKYAFILMGSYDHEKDHAVFPGGVTHMFGVSSVEEACCVASELEKEGFAAIELCGAFEEEGAKAVIEATHGKVAVGYVVHLPVQDELFRKVFG